MRYSLEEAVVDQPKEWALNGCSNLHEFGAQLIYLTRQPKRPYLQEEDMPVAFSHVSMPWQSLEHHEKQEGFHDLQL